MSSPEPENLDAFFTVFDGSSPEHASHARLLWSSMSLLPPVESRLVSANIRQRMPVSRGSAKQSSAPQQQPPRSLEPALPQRLEERRRYEAMAEQRRETMALLRRQREQRLLRDGRLSVDVKPKPKPGGEKTAKLQTPSDSELDCELVKQLQ